MKSRRNELRNRLLLILPRSVLLFRQNGVIVNRTSPFMLFFMIRRSCRGLPLIRLSGPGKIRWGKPLKKISVSLRRLKVGRSERKCRPTVRRNTSGRGGVNVKRLRRPQTKRLIVRPTFLTYSWVPRRRR